MTYAMTNVNANNKKEFRIIFTTSGFIKGRGERIPVKDDFKINNASNREKLHGLISLFQRLRYNNREHILIM